MRNRFVLFALLLPIVGACSDDGDNASTPSVTAPMSTPATSPSVSASSEIAVAISDFKFDPQTVSVPVGGTVVWTNNDGQQHTATSAGNFDAGAIEPQASIPVTFDAPGTFTYICSFHPFMTGTVTVG